MIALTCSRRNSLTSSTLPVTRTGECWYGLERPRHPHLPQCQPLHHRLNRTSHSKTYRDKPHLRPLPLIPPKPNAVNSRSCSATSSILPNSPASLILRSCERLYVRISRSAPRLSPALMDISPNSLVTGSSSTLAIPTHMKMTPKEQYGLGWEFLLPW